MLIFKHRPMPFGEENQAVCGVIVKSRKYLVEQRTRVNCPLCKVIDKIDTPERVVSHIDQDIADLVAMRNQILEEKI